MFSPLFSPSRKTSARLAVAGLALWLAPAFAAHAERRGPLDGAPAVRHRHELLDGRFEIGPSMGFTLNRNYRHSFMVGGKIEYHVNEWLSFGSEIAAGVPFEAGLLSEIEQSYAGRPADWAEVSSRLSEIKLAGDIRAVFTPIRGKIAIFSALFLAYDVYVFGGFGMGLLANGTDDPGVDAANEGFRPGAAWGLGAHFWANRFIAIGLEFKDLMFSDNQSGGDTTRGLTGKEQDAGGAPIIDGDDASFGNHFFAGLNVTFFFPRQHKISD